MTTLLYKLPVRNKGRQTKEKQEYYQKEVGRFCETIKQIRSTSDFSFSSRGWCYALEGAGIIKKNEFNQAQILINECRKNGMLPIDIASVDESRGFGCIESLDNNTAEEEAEFWVDYVLNDVGNDYTPYSFWESQECYCQMLVEKIDLRKLFEPICNKLKIPIANAKGWPDIHMRAAMMQRYKFWEGKGKRPVLLYCGDFDPVGLQISDSYRNMFTDISGAVGWYPDSLIIDRFGLNYDFIQSAGLSWIENLITGNTNEEKDLADPRHKDHNKPHVQDYIKAYGARKVEANAIVVVPEMGRKLCSEAIEKYVSEDAPDEYVENLTDIRQDVTNQIKSILKERLNAE